jgi:hypothetical protein
MRAAVGTLDIVQNPRFHRAKPEWGGLTETGRNKW